MIPHATDAPHAPEGGNPADVVESGIISVFGDGARMLGLPPSVGMIYGLFFASQGPLSLDDVAGRLGISRGSASQGLRLLRQFGALREVDFGPGRREFFAADVELKKIVGGFTRSQLLPQLGTSRRSTDELAARCGTIADPAQRAFLAERLAKLTKWQTRARQALALMERFLD
jgi:HTH-type transcriptional regulator, glycine betaine synthesis regulator